MGSFCSRERSVTNETITQYMAVQLWKIISPLLQNGYTYGYTTFALYGVKNLPLDNEDRVRQIKDYINGRFLNNSGMQLVDLSNYKGHIKQVLFKVKIYDAPPK